MEITGEMLKQAGVDEGERERFRKLYGDRVEVTEEWCRDCAQDFVFNKLAERLLTRRGWAVFRVRRRLLYQEASAVAFARAAVHIRRKFPW